MTFKKPLLLAFEVGYSALPGVTAMTMNSWNDARRVLRELKKPEVKEAFETIVIDTADIAYEMVEKFICAQNDVGHISDGKLTYGKGADLAYKEFNDFITSISRLGYGVVMISHSKDKTFKEEGQPEYTKKAPTLTNKALLVFQRTADILGYVSQVPTGEFDQDNLPIVKSILITRDNPKCVAGTRFKDFPTFVDLSYDALVSAIGDAVDKMSTQFTTTQTINHLDEGLNLDDLKAEFESVKDKLLAEKGADVVPKIVSVIEDNCGVGVKVASLGQGDETSLKYVIDTLKEML